MNISLVRSATLSPDATQAEWDDLIVEVMPEPDPVVRIGVQEPPPPEFERPLALLDRAITRVLHVSSLVARARAEERPLLLSEQDADWLADAVIDLLDANDAIASEIPRAVGVAAASDADAMVRLTNASPRQARHVRRLARGVRPLHLERAG